MAISPNFIETVIAPDPKELMQAMTSEKRPKGSAIWQLRNEITPSDLYCYFAARFGSPNGLQNFLRKNDSDNLIHWEWLLCCEYGWISFLGMNFRTEIWLIGEFPFVTEDKAELVNQIKADFVNYGKVMSETRKSLEHWVEFVNPYQRLHKSVNNLLSELKSLELQPEDDAVPDFTSADNFSSETWSEVSAKYTKGLGLCFGIRSMLPIMAEAYVNLLLFVFMRPELKNDDRLRENTIRQAIDIRIKSLQMTCIGFERPIEYTSEECKAYHSLVNERNDMLHGNVVLEKLRFNEVYFNGTVPIFKEYRSLWQRTVGVEIGAVGLHRLAQEVKVVEELVEYLSSCLRPEIKAQFEKIAMKRDLGQRIDNGRIGILFPDRLVDMFPVFAPSDDEEATNA